MAQKNFLYCEETDTKINPNDVVIIANYPNIKWIAKHGWYKLGTAQKNGWYFISISDKTVLPIEQVDITTISKDEETSELKPTLKDMDVKSAEYAYIVIPGTNIRIYEGDYVKISGRPRLKFIAHCGWYIYQGAQNYGWYFEGLKDGEIVPVTTIDLKLCTLTEVKTQGSNKNDGKTVNYTRPFTEADAELLNRTFITLDTIAQRDNLDPTKLINGRIVRINNVGGAPAYYIWNSTTSEWEPIEYSDSIKRVIGTYDNPVILSELDPDVYLVYGQYKISPNDPTVYITFADILSVINREDEKALIKVIDSKSITDYIVEDESVTLVSIYATTDYIDHTYAKIEYVDSKFDVLEAQIQELIDSLDGRIREIAKEEDRLYSTDIAKSYIDNLFN